VINMQNWHLTGQGWSPCLAEICVEFSASHVPQVNQLWCEHRLYTVGGIWDGKGEDWPLICWG